MKELIANRRGFVAGGMKALAADRSGATVVEYGLIAAAIASAILAITALLQSSFGDLAGGLAKGLTP